MCMRGKLICYCKTTFKQSGQTSVCAIHSLASFYNVDMRTLIWAESVLCLDNPCDIPIAWKLQLHSPHPIMPATWRTLMILPPTNDFLYTYKIRHCPHSFIIKTIEGTIIYLTSRCLVSHLIALLTNLSLLYNQMHAFW